MALNCQNTEKDPQRILKIKSFIDQYNWKEINFSSDKEDWEKFEVSNKLIALNIWIMYLIILKE